MPTYDYQCRDCGTVTEVIHAMSEDGPTVCDACGGTLRRVLYPAGIIFKGSGFYRTDSRAAPESSSASKVPKEGTSTGDGSAAAPSDGGTAPSPSTPTDKPSNGTSGTASGSTSGD